MSGDAKLIGTVEDVLCEAKQVLRQETTTGRPSLVVIAYKVGNDLFVTGCGRTVHGDLDQEAFDAVATALAPYAGNVPGVPGRKVPTRRGVA